MRSSEYKVFKRYEEQGYDCIKKGIPDLILLKDGKISFVEVKSPSGTLSESQERAIQLLTKHGFSAKVEIVKNVKKFDKFPNAKKFDKLPPPIFTENERIEFYKRYERTEPELARFRLGGMKNERT